MSEVREQLFIDGRWVRAAHSVPSISAVDDHLLGQVPLASKDQLDLAVNAAGRALRDQTGWGGMSVDERVQMLRAFAERIDARREQLAELIAHEVGTPIGRAGSNNVDAASGLLRFYAEAVAAEPVVQRRPIDAGVGLVVREPIGVVAMIPAWNYPLSTLFFKLAPALARGCTAVIRPSTLTSLDTLLIAEAADEAGMPPGVVNVTPCDHDGGDYLVAHPGIDKVAFTGSTAVGRHLGAICGESLKPVTLELGGKSAAILLEDADLGAFLRVMGELCFANNGQTCTNNSRVLVPRSRAAEMSDAITQTVLSWKVGSPLDPKVEIGPQCSPRHRLQVLDHVDRAMAEGAKMLTPPQPQDDAGGAYVRPVVFANVDPSMAIFQEEVFGPVISITEFDGTPEDAVRLANDSVYGLSGAVFTEDWNRGLAVAQAVETGTFAVNCSSFEISVPFHGRKESGVGFELGVEALEAFTHYKSVFLPPRAPAEIELPGAVTPNDGRKTA